MFPHPIHLAHIFSVVSPHMLDVVILSTTIKKYELNHKTEKPIVNADAKLCYQAHNWFFLFLITIKLAQHLQ